MINENKKTRIRLLIAVLAGTFSLTTFSSQIHFLNICGPSYLAVGKPDATYNISYYVNGTFCECRFSVDATLDYPPYLVCIADNGPAYQNLGLTFDTPANECFLVMTARLTYMANTYPVTYPFLLEERLVEVQKPVLITARTGLNGVVYENNATAVPIHWNIDDDDRSGFGVVHPNISYGEDYRQYEFLSENGYDDDLYSIQAYIENSDLDTAGCNFKIKTPDSMRLWYTQNKSALCCDSNSVFETNCNIVDWFNTHANSPGNRLYVEWVVPPNTTTNEYIEFYCNGVQFAKLRYKGYALSNPAYINMPTKSERTFFEGFCELDGCEWGINKQGSMRLPDRNSIAEAVDPHWTRYGEAFVATKTSPVCPDIYTLRNGAYSNFVCRCMSMDTFNNHNYLFEEADVTAFFTILNFWTYNYLDIDLHGALGDIVYYSGPFAATRVPSYWLTNCRPSWDIFTSRFFNQPKIVHNPYQLESTRAILDTYVIDLP
ncbi:hypothetical protein IKW72_09145 [bacterium]|nr:hypothetical protein [bacterium]MBR5625145.1 hypothetical protein [bacterium]